MFGYYISQICEVNHIIVILLSNIESIENNLKFIEVEQKLIFYKFDKNESKYIPLKSLDSETINFVILEIIPLEINSNYIIIYINFLNKIYNH